VVGAVGGLPARAADHVMVAPEAEQGA